MAKKKLTKEMIEQLAKEFIELCSKEQMYGEDSFEWEPDVCVWYNGKQSRYDYDKHERVLEENVNPNDWFPVGDKSIFHFTVEGSNLSWHLYDKYEFPRQFRNLFEKYGLFSEPYNNVYYSLWPADDDMEVEYTSHYVKPEPINVRREKENLPEWLGAVAMTWDDLTAREPDHGSCVIGAQIEFEWFGEEYFISSPPFRQGSLSWEKYTDLICNFLKECGCKNVWYNPGRMD